METTWKVSEVFEPEKMNINKWNEEDRPRERLMKYGPAKLSTAELLAILISTGNTEKNAIDLMKEVLRENNDSLKRLGQCTVEDLMTHKGIGEAKAVTILAACELGRRREHEDAMKIADMSSSENIYRYMTPKLRDLATEEAWILLLNNNFRLIKAKCLSEGGYSETAVDIRLIIREAILAKATVIILVHNHPSGNPHPSGDDNRLTTNVKEACRIMRLHLGDHIIIGDNDYYSYHENGKL